MEDMDMFGRMYSSNGREEFINKYLIEYTIDRENSIMNNIDLQTLEDWKIAFSNLVQNKDYKGIKETLYKWVVKNKIRKQSKRNEVLKNERNS
ncbi:hypothetical protein [Mycoplasma todarodis]|uniref:hypothetical protein n=1 Tax=Mycoplasma todarodis TaxID=1937191 RepID=UPI003B2A0BC9